MLKKLLLVLLIFSGCFNQEPIKIGLSVSFKGKYGWMGRTIKDSCVLATEEVNRSNGINGRKIELIIKDEENDPQKALKRDKELIDMGVEVIIGHITSSITKAVLPLINKHKVLMISPSVASPFFSGKDDWFFRISNSLEREVDPLISYCYNTLKIRKIIGIYDKFNASYAEQWTFYFNRSFEKAGGKAEAPLFFFSNKEFSYFDLASQLLTKKEKIDGVVIAAGSLDAALFTQQIRKIAGSDIPVISSSWAKNEKLIEYGGTAVEKIIFSEMAGSEKQTEKYNKFKKNYFSRFKKNPDTLSIYTYDTFMIIIEALKARKTGEHLKDSILRIRKFNGLQTIIEFDDYGDVSRKTRLIKVENGQFSAIQQ